MITLQIKALIDAGQLLHCYVAVNFSAQALHGFWCRRAADSCRIIILTQDSCGMFMAPSIFLLGPQASIACLVTQDSLDQLPHQCLDPGQLPHYQW